MRRPRARGQSMVLFCLMTLLVTLMVCLTLSFSMKVREKMEAQHVADLAAYSSAVATARTFNSIALMRRAQTGQLVAQAGVLSLISWTTMMRANLNVTRLAASSCPAAAGVLTDLDEANLTIQEKWHELDAKAGVQAYNIQTLGGFLGDIQGDMYDRLVTGVSGDDPDSFATKLAAMASKGDPFEGELKGGHTSVSVAELGHATSGGDSFGMDMAMASRGYEFVTRRQGMKPFAGSDGVLGKLFGAGGRVRFLDTAGNGGSAYWGKTLGHGGRADEGDFAWAEDHATVEVTFPGCAPFTMQATAGVRSTDIHEFALPDDHWWTPAIPGIGSEDATAEKKYRHTLGPCDLGPPTSCPDVWIGGITYNTGDQSDDNNWAQPKLFALVQRDYKARGLKADPWNLFFRFRFTPATTSEFDSRGIYLADGTDISVQSALATGLAYYHRPRRWREPPNLWNPFWRATLVSADIDNGGDPRRGGNDVPLTVGEPGGAAFRQLIANGYKGVH